MKAFEELISLAKSGNIPKTLSGLERNTVHGLRGILLQFKEKEMDTEQCRMVCREMELDYDHAQTEQMIHQNACRMRVEMAKVNREMKLHGCPLCKRALEIIDGRKRTDESQDTAEEPDTKKVETVGGSVCQGASRMGTKETEL